MNDSVPIPGVVSLLIALQFASFGWRVNREMSVGDRGEQTWIPITDKLNIGNMLLTFIACVLLPLITNEFGEVSRACLGAAIVLILLHPVNMLGHYELLSGLGRIRYSVQSREAKQLNFEGLPYCPKQEAVSVSLSITVALVVGVSIYAYA